jgi:hypothetical protein
MREHRNGSPTTRWNSRPPAAQPWKCNQCLACPAPEGQSTRFPCLAGRPGSFLNHYCRSEFIFGKMPVCPSCSSPTTARDKAVRPGKGQLTRGARGIRGAGLVRICTGRNRHFRAIYNKKPLARLAGICGTGSGENLPSPGHEANHRIRRPRQDS